MKQKSHITFMLNAEQVEVAFAPHKTLLEVLLDFVKGRVSPMFQLSLDIIKSYRLLDQLVVVGVESS